VTNTCFPSMTNKFSFLLRAICPSLSAKFNRKKGFTLLELMIVVAIIGTLAAIAVPNYRGYVERAKYTTVIFGMNQIEKKIKLFVINSGRLPLNLAEIGLGNIQDPWGTPYQYLNISTVKGKGKLRKDHANNPVNSDYDLYSKGPDGKSVSPFTAKASRDDIVRANDGAYLGRVSDY
jgi:general secretion pathway protein G